jgi:hypothetical protein
VLVSTVCVFQKEKGKTKEPRCTNFVLPKDTVDRIQKQYEEQMDDEEGARRIAENVKNAGVHTWTEDGQTQQFSEHVFLSSVTDPLDALAAFLTMDSNAGNNNVCVAFSLLEERTKLVVAANRVVDIMKREKEMSKSDTRLQSWKSLFDESDAGRKRLFQEILLTLKAFVTQSGADKSDKNESDANKKWETKLGDNFSKSVMESLPESEFKSAEVEETMREMLVLVEFSKKKLDSDVYDPCLCIELFRVAFTIRSHLLVKFTDEAIRRLSTTLNAVHNYARWRAVLTWLKSSECKRLPFVEKVIKRVSKEIDGTLKPAVVVAWKRCKEDEDVKSWFPKVRDSIPMLEKVIKFVSVNTFEGKPTAVASSNDIHCEVALYNYLVDSQTVRLDEAYFHIGRPCCGGCTLYFFGCLKNSSIRPKMLAASFHFCASLFTIPIEGKARAQLEEAFGLVKSGSSGNNNNE